MSIKRFIDTESIEFQNYMTNAIGDALSEHLTQIEESLLGLEGTLDQLVMDRIKQNGGQD